jgi:hypothetical protein
MFEFIIQQIMLGIYYALTAAVNVLMWFAQYNAFGIVALCCILVFILIATLWLAYRYQ